MIIRTFGDSGRQRECEKRLAEKGSEYQKLILLPIPTSRDGVTVTGTVADFSLVCDEVVPGTLVAGYNIPEQLAEGLIEKGAEIYDAGLDEQFLVENAEITARGALGKILCELKEDISGIKVAIVGYGRIGQRLSRLLLFLGADVTVFSRKEETCTELALAGVNARRLTENPDFSDFLLIVNTAPACIMDTDSAREICRTAKIMDLASGNNFPGVTEVIKLSSVPDSMYPITAGRIYARYISNYL